MKNSSVLFLMIYHAVLVCSRADLKSADNIDDKEKLKLSGKKLGEDVEKQRHRRSSSFHPFYQVPCDTCSHTLSHHPSHLYLYDQESHHIPQFFSTHSCNCHIPFNYERSVLPCPLHLIPQKALDKEEHAIYTATEQPSLTAANHEHTELSSAADFNEEPATQLESPVPHHSHEETTLCHEDAIPPTLHHSPYDVFPCSQQTLPPVKQPDYPAKPLNHKKATVDSSEPKTDSADHIDYFKERPIVVYPETHVDQQQLLDHPEEEVHHDAPPLTLTFEGFEGGAENCPPQKIHQSPNIINKNAIKVDNSEPFKQNSMNNSSGSEKSINLGPSDIVVVKIDKKCLNDGSSICDHNSPSFGCPNEYEEDCESITTRPLQYKPTQNKETIDSFTLEDDFNHNVGTTAVTKDNGNTKSKDVSSVMSKEQLHNMKSILQEIIKNQNTKPTSFTDEDSIERTSTGNSGCSCKCLNKLCKCLRLAKNVGDYISDKARQALRGLNGLTSDKVKNCDHEHCVEIGHSSLES